MTILMTTHIYYFLLLIPSISAFLNPPVKCPKELFNQKFVCGPGQALSSVTWDEKVPECRQFHATCRNATSSCFEHCEWATTCQTNASVSIEMEYVRGLDVYYQMMDALQTVSFLCCHSEDLKTGILDCDGKSVTQLDGKTQPQLFSIMSQATSKNYMGDLPIKATYCPVLNIPTCPPDKIQTNLEGSSFPAPGAGGPAGAGAGGYYGLSLLSCYGPSGMLTGVVLNGCAAAGTLASPQDCLAICTANPQCTAMTYNTQSSQCYSCTGVGYFPTSNPVWVAFILCVTPAQRSQLLALQSAG